MKCNYWMCKINGPIRYVIQLYYGMIQFPQAINVKYYDSVECMAGDLEEPNIIQGLEKEEWEYKWLS